MSNERNGQPGSTDPIRVYDESSSSPVAGVRKASDVVIDLENKVDLLTKMIYGNDINSKLILDRLNRIAGSLEKLVLLGQNNAKQSNAPGPGPGSGPGSGSSQSQRPYLFTPASAAMGDQADDFPAFRAQNEADTASVLVEREEPGFSMTVETEPKGARRTARPETYHENVPGKKVTPIFQRVFDETGTKMIFMADVEILRAEDHSLHTKTRTTAAGKWQAPLPPGHYVVNIMKRENAGRKRLEYTKLFEIRESDSPIELEAAKLE